MVRCFIAINLPSEIKDKILSISKSIHTDVVRLVKPENLHITLKFLGEVSEDQVEEIKTKLSSISFSPFILPIEGIGVFPNENYVKVVWIGCKSDELEKLSDEMEKLLGKSDRQFTSHLTIARVTKKINMTYFLEKNKNLKVGDIQINSFELMKSELTPSGPIYTKLAIFKAQN
ncbi:MAG TPA: RNA 2',3'-cyclic phosphodiesterase [Candidatus Bilamarchaeaceae archaeon]|nr:RNA 2',3'-cyclic phosphodiesterase [Candidatus Bilamarchaeaceae archaeon]